MSTGSYAATGPRGSQQPPPRDAECSQQRLAETRARAHARCVVCGARDDGPARLCFTVTDNGGVEAHICINDDFEGYDGILHGGIIATLLDAAMTNCLFAQGRRGLTAELLVRFRHPVVTGTPLRLWAGVERSSPPLFVLRAEIRQTGQVRATAVGKFMAPSSGRD
jgi:acyl-coenzyme A thioesterase PaaI-like protein